MVEDMTREELNAQKRTGFARLASCCLLVTALQLANCIACNMHQV